MASSLHAAVESGNLDTVLQYIADKGLSEINALNPAAEHPSDTNSGTPLAIAIKLHHLHIAEQLLKSGANANQSIDDGSGKGYTVVHIAAKGGDLDALKLLKSHRADFGRQGDDGWTPLHAAAFSGKRQVLGYLADNGCKVNTTNHHSVPALYFSASHGRVGDCREFLNRNADMTVVDVNGDHLMHHVLHYQLSKMFEGEYDVPDCQLDVAVVLTIFGMPIDVTNMDGAVGGRFYYDNIPSFERVLKVLSHNADKFRTSKTEWNYMTLLRARMEHFVGMGLELKHAVDLTEAMANTEKERDADRKRREAERPAGGCPVMRSKKKGPTAAAAVGASDGSAASASHHPADMDLSKVPPGTDPSNGQCPFFQKKETAASAAPSPLPTASSQPPKPAAPTTAAPTARGATPLPSATNVVSTVSASASTVSVVLSDPNTFTWKNLVVFLFENRTMVLMVVLAFMCGVLFEQRFGRRF